MTNPSNPSHAELLREYLDQLSQAGGEARLPKWTDWLKLRVGGAVAIGAALALAGCDDSVGSGGNQGGSAGTTNTASSGGMGNAGTLYGIVMASGGTDATTNSGGAGATTNSGGAGGITNPVALYAAIMVGGAGGTSAGLRYGVPISAGGATTNSGQGGVVSVPIYGIVMEPTGGTSSQ
jgi:hypothetical protein